ncbi:peptidoglycan-binding protein [Streptomyces physcomitrii]|uniref:peptidoglycan-binding protein n=1 Tax=Streptomyces physcomitrii TaxID=2724184 RepID=UPI0033C851C1
MPVPAPVPFRPPVFEEYEPADGDCRCPGCGYAAAGERGSGSGPGASWWGASGDVFSRWSASGRGGFRQGGGPRGARRALVAVAAAGSVLGTAAGAGALPARTASAPGAPRADAEPGTPQGGRSGLHGTAYGTAPAATTRAAIIDRAKTWVTAEVPYSMGEFHRDGYRQDCSGFVSMVWQLGTNVGTGGLARYGTRIAREDLEPGDILLFHNPADPGKGSHVTVFGGWSDPSHRSYLAYEQTRPHTLARKTPYPYWSHAEDYVPYRYRGLTPHGGTSGADAVTVFPGLKIFAPGVRHAGITRLGELLAARGGRQFYPEGPGPRWTEADRRAVAAFQRAQGWRGTEANGIPGPATWDYLMHGKGRDIVGVGVGAAGVGAVDKGAGADPEVGAGAREGARARVGGVERPRGGGTGGTAGRTAPGPDAAEKRAAPDFPGRAAFRPGKSSIHIARLSRQLVKRGYGRFYPSGPGSRWTESDRRAVEAFQRAQGWRGSRADGVPGPETWQRLFS